MLHGFARQGFNAKTICYSFVLIVTLCSPCNILPHTYFFDKAPTKKQVVSKQKTPLLTNKLFVNIPMSNYKLLRLVFKELTKAKLSTICVYGHGVNFIFSDKEREKARRVFRKIERRRHIHISMSSN